ncbi:hypothetical protein DFR54_101302 [Vagococcus fluvialis]|uniref:Uncharacterized protein n=1 Tax=Vagococcus fluvialis TaxID=2738 RepID=A0A369B8G6_9ENTE|nr:hypothetical protein [Vagococcus fluvialis]MBO0443776.1 hypothetical protein [Vagococcus fluvialis]MCM2139243.1 hypothetical protein [Vagococcus fluvialis]RCX15964.1 hypothetical protein DFR54_101302 [Vagococcus fluvialis]RSU04161.1 hypothetical protein CBF32_01955 [Vagococcus fluvialis]UDM73442.1 hypothetical protein K5K99_11000 [Vagococcus fluvialis]
MKKKRKDNISNHLKSTVKTDFYDVIKTNYYFREIKFLSKDQFLYNFNIIEKNRQQKLYNKELLITLVSLVYLLVILLLCLASSLPIYLIAIIITISLGLFISKILKNLRKRSDQYFFYKIIKDILHY